MFNFKSQLLGIAAVLPVAAVVSFAGSAQAVQLQGSVGLNGTSAVANDGINPQTTTLRFLDVDGVDAFGDFANFLPGLAPNPSSPNITISTLNLTKIAGSEIVNSVLSRAEYTTGVVTPFINFGERTLNGTTAILTFDLDNTVVTRTKRNSSIGTSIADITLDGLTGVFNFDGQTVGEGFLNASLSGAASTYQITIDPIRSTPEPTTIIGLGLVASGMVISRRRKAVKA
jgi:hypothetical protein